MPSQGNQQIARRIFGTQQVSGARDVTRQQAKAIARTATNAIANKARQALYATNADVIQAEVYTATLDSRTTMICASLDGKQFRVGKGPIPPLHINCRSTRVPSIDGRVIGQRPMKASTERGLLREFAEENGIDPVRRRADLPRGFKGRFDKFARKRVRELTGRVPASESYSEFLRNQTKEFQEEVLGVERARLFREGQLELDSFVDDAGRPFSLDELMKREPAAFRNNIIALGEILRMAA